MSYILDYEQLFPKPIWGQWGNPGVWEYACCHLVDVCIIMTPPFCLTTTLKTDLYRYVLFMRYFNNYITWLIHTWYPSSSISGESAQMVNLTLIKVKVIYSNIKTEKLSKYWNLSSSNMSYILDYEKLFPKPMRGPKGNPGVWEYACCHLVDVCIIMTPPFCLTTTLKTDLYRYVLFMRYFNNYITWLIHTWYPSSSILGESAQMVNLTLIKVKVTLNDI